MRRIVDAQIHVWGSGLPSNMAHRQVTAFATEEALSVMDEGGIDAAVIHPPDWDPNSVKMALNAAQDFPDRFAILGSVPLNQPDKSALVDTWRSQSGYAKRRDGKPLATSRAAGPNDRDNPQHGWFPGIPFG